MFRTIAIDKFWRRNRGYKLGDLKDEVTKPSIEDHLDGPDLGSPGWSSVNLTKGTKRCFLWKLQILSGLWCIERTFHNFSVEEQVQFKRGRFTLSKLFEVGQVLFGGGANADSDRTRCHFGQEVTCACWPYMYIYLMGIMMSVVGATCVCTILYQSLPPYKL